MHVLVISATVWSTIVFFLLAGGMLGLWLNLRRHIRRIQLPEQSELIEQSTSDSAASSTPGS